ncbi:MAG: permease-like cell division protein FtsX [Bacilli bacterium]|nr:permease-like cell division protein FtsX [Bacilli bacterium]
MKFFRLLGRSIRDAFKSVGRNFSLSLASISCIVITLTIIAISIVISYNVNNFSEELKKDLTIVAFVSNDALDTDLDKIKTKIGEISNVESVTLKDKTSIMKEMMDEDDAFKTAMSEWDEESNPLQHTYLVKVNDIEKIAETANTIKNLDNIDVVKYGEGMVDQLVTVFKVIQKVAIVAVVALVLMTMFLIVNTIKLTIFSRKREISIMRLVGASNFAIKLPFVVEGMILGFIGSIIPVFIMIYGYYSLYRYFGGRLFTDLIKLVHPEPFIYLASLIVIVIGILVGMFGSGRAVRKYLKV